MKYNLTSTLLLMLCVVCLMFAATSFAGTTTYIYDELDRLKEVQFGNGDGIRYEYDEIGNLLSKTPFGNVFTIAASASEGGSISPMGTLTITAGNSKTYTIAPLPGYHITNVVVDGVSQGAITSYPFTNIAANHTIAANFAFAACANQPVRIAGKASYATFQAAYNAAVEGDTIQSHGQEFTESFTASQPISVTIDGGYDCNYTTNPGTTIIHGAPRLSAGTVKLKNIRIAQ